MTKDNGGGPETDWDEHKSVLMESVLGKEHDMVSHAWIPFAVGGALDLYYYPNGIAGTGIATKELATTPTEGSSNEFHRTYELVMFTRYTLDLDEAEDQETEFGAAHWKMQTILNLIARYSLEATLNPHDTCEFPEDMDDVGGKCLIFDDYACISDDVVERFGLLLVLEVHRSEMEFAREEGTEELITLLKEQGYYPYSDLDRPAVA
ncbi:MAG TPA: suppressor of fused domain protein [Planctomycetaceae bacterium]|nr:suppressor of fused domain protein [Planctomycetaceae bacterium]